MGGGELPQDLDILKFIQKLRFTLGHCSFRGIAAENHSRNNHRFYFLKITLGDAGFISYWGLVSVSLVLAGRSPAKGLATAWALATLSVC